MGAWQRLLQRIQTSVLDLVAVERSPGFVGDYQVSNELVNTLAHLVGQDGVASRLLRICPDGRLAVMPPSWGMIPETVRTGALTSTAPETLYFDTAEHRLVRISAGDAAGIIRVYIQVKPGDPWTMIDGVPGMGTIIFETYLKYLQLSWTEVAGSVPYLMVSWRTDPHLLPPQK